MSAISHTACSYFKGMGLRKTIVQKVTRSKRFQVDNCHVETRAKCKDVTHSVPVPVCDDQGHTSIEYQQNF